MDANVEHDDLGLEEFSFAQLAARDPATIERLSHVCKTIGFFVIIDHPVQPDQLASAFRAFATFFALPDDVKQRYHQTEQIVWPQTCRGYSAFGEEHLAPKPLPSDQKQLIDFGFDRPLDPDLPFTGPNVLPSDDVSPGFSAVLKLQKTVQDTLFWPVVRALSAALGQAPDALDSIMRDPTLITRGIHYPAAQGTAEAHTDNGLFTLLFLQDGRVSDSDRSLQVFSKGAWRPVRGDARKIVVNLGDHCGLLTGNRFVSTLHRVKHTGRTTRMSLAFFYYPNIHAKFVPIDGSEEDMVATRDVMLNNFAHIWTSGKGAGRDLSTAEKAAIET